MAEVEDNWGANINQNELNNNTEEKSLNDLLNQVAELDEIYSDTQAKLMENNIEVELTSPEVEEIFENKAMEIDNDFDDNNTYSSLQMAFKNPIDMLDKFEEVISAQGPVIDLVSPVAEKRLNDSEKLPPLPPKRIKKLDLARPLSQTIYASSNSITLSTEQAQSLLGSNSSLVRKPVSRAASFNVVRKPEYLAPQKHLPPTPATNHASTTTLPNPKKRGFFDKLFRRGSKRSENNSNLSLTNRGSIASFKSLRDQSAVPAISGGHMKTLGVKSSGPDVIRISLKGPLNEENPVEEKKDEVIHDIDRMDLTEAEHYALYTAIAPHATQSEFDETSCYYAPVEGGKIMS